MPKQIKEFLFDQTTGEINTEYDDNSTEKFNLAAVNQAVSSQAAAIAAIEVNAAFVKRSASGDVIGLETAGGEVLNAAVGGYVFPEYTTEQINSVISDVSLSGGGTVLLAPGTYVVLPTSSTSAIVVKSNVHLTGCGKNTIVKLSSVAPGGVHTIAVDGGAENVEISNFVVDGNRDRLSSYFGEDDCIGGPNAVNPHVHSMTIFNAGDCAIDFDNGKNVKVSNNTIYNCNGNGVHLAGSVGGSGCAILNNNIKNCGHARQAAGLANAAGIDTTGVNSIVSGNFLEDCYTGIVALATNSLVTNNVVTSPSATMYIGIRGSSGAVVKGNTISGSSSSAIASCQVVEGNLISGGSNGVSCTTNGFRVIGNVIKDNMISCVSISSPSITYGRVYGNHMERAGTKVNCTAGAGVVIDGNDFVGTGTAVGGTTAASMNVRVNP